MKNLIKNRDIISKKIKAGDTDLYQIDYFNETEIFLSASESISLMNENRRFIKSIQIKFEKRFYSKEKTINLIFSIVDANNTIQEYQPSFPIMKACHDARYNSVGVFPQELIFLPDKTKFNELGQVIDNLKKEYRDLS